MTTEIKTKSLFGSSGVRLAFGRQLMDIAMGLGLVCSRHYTDIVVGEDTRTSSEILKQILVSGLQAGGAHVTDAGVVTTPTLAFAAREHDLAIMVTASHNPPQYNGFKLMEPDGSGIGVETQKAIEDALSGNQYYPVCWENLGTLEKNLTARKEHITAIKRYCNVEKSIRVAVDCCAGAACGITPMLLEEMGCDVIKLYCDPDGFPPRGAEPFEANLHDLRRTVLDNQASVGIAHDIDADRMMIIDNKGRFVSGDRLLVLLARYLKADEIVTTLDASMTIEERGFNVRRTRIGDIFVSQEMKHGGKFGGEPSGSWVLPWITLCPDGIHAAALTAALASRHQLSDLVDEIPEYPIVRGSVENHGLCFEALEGMFERDGEIRDICRVDGLKVIYDDSWVLIRPSGTEPKIRITIEARDDYRLRELYQKVIASLECHGLKP